MTFTKSGIFAGTILGALLVFGCAPDIGKFENVPVIELARSYSIEKTRGKHGNAEADARAEVLAHALLKRAPDEKNTRDIDGRSPAHFFAGTADEDFLEKWTAAGGRIDLRDLNNAAPLSVAVAERNPALIRELFSAVREDDAAVGHALFIAIALRNYEELDLLLSLGANPNTRVVGTAYGWKSDPVLFFALERGDARAVKMLSDAGADPNARGMFQKDNPVGMSALHFALEGDSEIVETLLKAGANPNEMLTEEDGMQRPLLTRAFWSASRAFAGEEDSFRNTQLLVEYGADVNAVRIYPESASDSTVALWKTPLDEAILQGNVPVMKFLLSRGAKFSPNVGVQLREIQHLLKRNNGENPESVYYGVPVYYKETIAYLEAQGVKPMSLPVSHLKKVKSRLYQNYRKPERVRELLASSGISEREREELASFVLSHADLRDAEVFKICYGVGGRVPEEKLSRIIEGDNSELAEIIACAVGADEINAPDSDGASPLFRAVAFGSLNTFRVFLKHGGDVNGTGFGGYSILQAAECGFSAYPVPAREEILRLVKERTRK